MSAEGAAASPPDYAFEVAVASDVGTERPENEDCCAHSLSSATSGIVVVADGVSGMPGGGTASRRAVESTLRAYRELEEQPPARRLHRAVQQANIDVYDLAVVVPELRGMGTTLTAVVVDQGGLIAAHVGDSRIYLRRGRDIRVLTRDHTVVGERVRLGMLSELRARHHPDRSVLTRCLGRELIAAIDRITTPLQQDDRLIVCTDGLYNVLDAPEIAEIAGGRAPQAACDALIAAANERGTPDNLTVAVLHMSGTIPRPPETGGLRARLRRLVSRRGPVAGPVARR